MWTREVLKERAKAVLKTNYWKSFLISLVILIAGGDGNSGSAGGGGNNSVRSTIGETANQIVDSRSIIIIAIGAVLIVIAFRILLGYPLEVGGRRYFIRSAEYKDNRGCFSYAFDGRNYTGIIVSMLLMSIYSLLWTLLFIIPGIIKYYAYRMVPYLLADNPNIGAKRAIEISNEMTMGHKFDIFVLDLSFLGWYLLGALALGIGVLFVNPYVNATEAELYLVLRSNAIENGYCSYNELNGELY